VKGELMSGQGSVTGHRSLPGQRRHGPSGAPCRLGPLAQPAGLGTAVHAQDPHNGRGRPLDPDCGRQVRAAGFLPWLARHRLAWQRWRDFVWGRRRRRPPFNERGDVGGGPLVLTHLTHHRTARRDPLIAESRQQALTLSRLLTSMRMPSGDEAGPQRRGAARGAYGVRSA
jgi:hypothetical protein